MKRTAADVWIAENSVRGKGCRLVVVVDEIELQMNEVGPATVLRDM